MCSFSIKKDSWFFVLIFLVGFPFNRNIAQEYKLVWSDEFDGTVLDLTKWEYQIGNGSGGWGNNEKEYYRSENAIVNNGYLKIVAKKENFGGFNYTSARISTIHKGDWRYGKIEMRAKMPVGKGMWPAFWMMPTDNIYGEWAASGEIDIMEYLGHDSTTVYGTLHFGDSWPSNTSKGMPYSLSNSDFNDNFHTYTLIWEEGKIQWFVDGELYQTQTSWYTSGGNYPAPFDQQFHILLNLAVGGNWPGDPDASTVFPQEYDIDYVRVYQKSVTAVQGTDQKPHNFLLYQNFPNPFNPTTKIKYSIPQNGFVTIKIFNLLGQKVASLVNQEQRTGEYKIEFNASNLSSGIYLYRIQSGNYSSTKKMIVLK
ncbi:MAG: family 16 glycosylhydrolase [Bacteroidota bacterium]|jgi:beta-glucanase (GH16 family)